MLWRLLRYLTPYLGWVALTFVLIVLASAARQAGPFLTKIAVDDCIIPGNAEKFLQIIWIFVSLLGVQFVVRGAQQWTTNMIGQWAMRDVRMEIFTCIQGLPLGYFDRTPVGRLMAINTNDVDALNEMFTDGIVSIVSESFTVVAILGYIFYMDVELGVVTCLALPFASVATIWLQAKTFQAYRRARMLFGRFAASLQETISGIEVVQLFGVEKRSADRFSDENDSYLETRLQSTFYQAMYHPFMELGGTLLMALMLWYGGTKVLEGGIEWGVLVAMLQYVPRFFHPIRNAAQRFNTVQVALASSERVFELLDTVPEPRGGSHRPTSVDGEIEFRDVWFAYNLPSDPEVEPEWILKGVSFRVAPSESLAIVGATGAGKSTIINLVCGFYPIQRGAILIDDVDIREWDAEELRRRIGVVQQDVFLFAGDHRDEYQSGRPGGDA